MDERKVKADAEAIFRTALARVEPAALVRRAVRVEGRDPGTIVVEAALDEQLYPLVSFDRILVVGMGKAGASMAAGLEEALGDRISGGVVAVKNGYVESLKRIRLLEASHPVPDESSVRAAFEVLGLASGLDERTLVFVLVSGGGSSLLCAPAEGVTLADKAAATRLLLRSGATIQEMNAIRKHLSAIKGGRLAAALYPATIVSLVVSDVVGDDLDTIASGPTVPDPSTWADALAASRRRGVEAVLPRSVSDLLRRGAEGELPDTPKRGDRAFAKARTFLIGTNRIALAAAEAKARELGYESLVLTSRLTGESREAAQVLLGIGKDISDSGFPLRTPACLLVGGETTVTLRGEGRGGRNQEMALAFLAGIARSPSNAERLLLLAASTDGGDGPTDAAGAFASAAILERASAAGLDVDDYLGRNDSYSFFDRLGALLRTGPTNTNVCDLQILLVS